MNIRSLIAPILSGVLLVSTAGVAWAEPPPSHHHHADEASLPVAVQRRLAHLGYYHGAIDGDIGPHSRRAIRHYQADHGLPVTGDIDRPLRRSLGV
jgi:peptidoglycan hydrolase-like protein with peptidoglycan-binding domain